MYTRLSHIVHFLAFSLAIVWIFDFSYAAFAQNRPVISQSKLKKNLSIDGMHPGEQFGSSISSGDFNNDGFIDLVATAPFYSDHSSSWKGNARIFWGPEYSAKKSLLIIGENENDQFGTKTISIDINNDAIDDLVVSAYQADHERRQNAGKVYVFLGKKGFEQSASLYAEQSDLQYIGGKSNSRLGIALTKGDINGDSVDDLVMSAPGKLQDTGYVYALFGGFSVDRQQTFDVDEKSQLKIIGSKDELFGSSLTIGDFNGDGLGDLAIGAYLGSRNDIEHTGKVYLIKGRQFELASHNTRYEYDLQRFPELAMTLLGKQENEWFGFNISAHNINQDAFDDLIVGSFMYLYKNKSGKASIFHGNRDFLNTDIPHKPNQQIIGDVSENLIGSSIAVGDIDKNLSHDLILGAPGIGIAESSEQGIAYVISDMSDVPDGQYHLPNETKSAVFQGQHSDDWYGGSVHVADLNQDGFSDIIVGAPNTNAETGYDVGRIDVIYGETSIMQLAPALVHKQHLSRGDAVNLLVDGLELKTRHASFLSSCESAVEFCLFTFAIQSNNPDISLDNYLFYGDVPTDSPYFENVKVATMLNLIHGYFKEQGSPFKPNDPIKRIEALKVMLGAINAVDWKYRFEIKDEIDPRLPKHAWWYTRYLNFAVEKGVIENSDNFRSDENITRDEFIELLDAVKKYRDSVK